jgi:hypothetical protein
VALFPAASWITSVGPAEPSPGEAGEQLPQAPRHQVDRDRHEDDPTHRLSTPLPRGLSRAASGGENQWVTKMTRAKASTTPEMASRSTVSVASPLAVTRYAAVVPPMDIGNVMGTITRSSQRAVGSTSPESSPGRVPSIIGSRRP